MLITKCKYVTAFLTTVHPILSYIFYAPVSIYSQTGNKFYLYSDDLIFGSNLLLHHILVHYNAYFEYQDDPFDSTILRNRPEKFKLGSGMFTTRSCLFYSTKCLL